MKKLILALTCLFLAIPCQAKIITVDDDGPADFNTIQAAIDDSNDGDTIIVADGIYTGYSNRDIDFRKYDHGLPPGPTRAITVRSANGPGNCIIDCNGTESDPHGGFRFENGEDANSVIMGFTIINGFARCESFAPPFAVCEYLGGAIYCWRSSPTISNCIISGNTARYGGGIACYKSNPTVSNCIFVGNCASDGGGMGILNGSDAKIINCTFSGNVANYVGGGILNGSIMGQVGPEQPKLINCILWGNSPDEINVSNGTPVITYSNVEGGWAGDGNIDVDPCFIEPGHWEDPCNTPTMPWDDIWIHGDYHLQSQAGRWEPSSESWVTDANNSPAVDAGDPNSDWTAELWPHGKRINMGAYGGTPEASMSQLDIGNIANLDNDVNDIVNSLDLALFVGKWCYEEFLLAEDLNRDGFVNFNDFAIFGLQWSYPSAFEPGMTFHVDDCNMADGLSWTVIPESNEPRFSVWVEGRYIYFEDQMYANCCPEELGLDKEIDGNEITLYEIGYGGLCDCMCYFPITATLGPFEDGTYTVEVYDNYGNSLGVVEVTIGESPEPGMTFHVDDCNMADGLSWTVIPDSNEPRFSVWVEGRYIHFEDMMIANCCPDELGLEMTVEDSIITIYETEYTPGGCYCICDYPITATLGPFEDGTYTVEVYDNYGNSLGVVEVTIGGSPEPGITYQIEDCNRDASDVFAAEPPDLTRFTVTVDGLYIHFEDTMVANCCPDELGLEMTVEDSIITIYETEYTPGGCRCMCLYPVTATLGPFEPGAYTLEVYETMGGFIGSTTVVIAPPE